MPEVFILDDPVSTLDLRPNLVGALERNGVFTVKDLLDCCPRDGRCKCRAKHVLRFVNFGKKSLEDVYAALEKVGYYRHKS